MSQALPKTDIAIRVQDLSKRYRIEKPVKQLPHDRALYPLARILGRHQRARKVREFWALDGLTFDVARGERVAVIGRNGAGKTTLLKILSRITVPTRGEARIRGRLTSLLEVGTGFSSALTGRENVFVNASYHGLSRNETAERFDEIIEFSGIDPRFLDTRVKHYSSGMKVRLAFSVAAYLDPDIMLLDEVLAVGDMAFQEKCLHRVEEMVRSNRTVLFVSHSMEAVARFCERAIWLEQGHAVMDGPAVEVASAYTDNARQVISVQKWTPESAKKDFEAAILETGLDRESTDGSERSVSELADVKSPLETQAGRTYRSDEASCARLLSVCMINEDGDELKAATVDQPFGIQFVYDVLQSGWQVLPGAVFYATDGTKIFTAVYTGADYMEKRKDPGRYLSVLHVPPHLLNVGRVDISVSLTSPVSGKVARHVVVEKALSLDVYEAPFDARSARGTYRAVKGVVRPLLDWETKTLE